MSGRVRYHDAKRCLPITLGTSWGAATQQNSMKVDNFSDLVSHIQDLDVFVGLFALDTELFALNKHGWRRGCGGQNHRARR